MKILLSLGLIVFGTVFSFAQPNNVITAYMQLQEKQLDDARSYINKASEHVKTKEQAKTWYYRGKIYMAIYSDIIQGNDIYNIAPENALLEASTSFEKATGMNTDRIDENQLRREYQITANYLLNEGVSKYNDKDFTTAARLFKKTVDVQKDFEIVDSLAMYNVALASEKAGDMDQALTYYLECGRIGYNADVAFQSAALIYRNQGNTEGSLEVLDEGLAQDPNNVSLLITKINTLLAIDDFDGALFTIDQALVQMPDNPDLHYSRGTLLEVSDKKQAMIAYKKAIELKPDHVNALYNLGAAYYNNAVELRNADGATNATGVEELKMSRTYLERVEAISPGMEAVQNSLSIIKEILQD